MRRLTLAILGCILILAVSLASGTYLGFRLTQGLTAPRELDLRIESLSYLLVVHDLARHGKIGKIEYLIEPRVGLAVLNLASFYPYLDGQSQEKIKRALERVRESGMFRDDHSALGKSVNDKFAELEGRDSGSG